MTRDEFRAILAERYPNQKSGRQRMQAFSRRTGISYKTLERWWQLGPPKEIRLTMPPEDLFRLFK